MAWKKDFTEAEKKAYRQRKQKELQALFQKIDKGVRGVFQSERYREYLRVMSKFTHYSARNCLLIAMQMPNATHVAAYGKWKMLGRQVERGQPGIAILAPMPFRRERETEQEDEEEIVDIGYKVTYVFDISQTSGKPLPELVQELNGNLESAQMEAIFRGLRKVVGIPIRFADTGSGAKGYYSPSEQEIVIQPGMSDVQTVKTGIHEAAHKLLHDPELEIATVNTTREEKETQAESIAYCVASALHLDTSEYSFPYIASWSEGKTLEKLNKYLDEIQTAVQTLTDAIETQLQELAELQEIGQEEAEDITLGGIAI